MNKAKLNPEYSIKYPEDSSASDSDTSKGTFLSSVSITIQNSKAPSYKGKINHKLCCSVIIVIKLKDWE